MMKNTYKNLFLLDPKLHFLNHGSFGACPKPVFQEYQRLQRELENQPVDFLGKQIRNRMVTTRESLAAYLNCQADDLVYFPNPTTALNMIVRNLNLQAGDEILSTDHEYGACERTWRFVAKKVGAKYISHPIPLPISSHEEFVERFWSGVTSNTKVIFLSHITSPTALTFPVEAVCQMAREAGIMSIVDGAHAPGHISVDIQKIGADFYLGACHKWLCAPKGSAFLYAKKDVQGWLDPLVVSWGYQAIEPSSSQFVDYHEWQGTRDMSAFLAVPSALEFLKSHDWDSVRQDCHNLTVKALEQINHMTGLESIYADHDIWFKQMAAIRLPSLDVIELQKRLYTEFMVEIPVFVWNKQPILRLSVQGYNDKEDIDALIEGLRILVPELSET